MTLLELTLSEIPDFEKCRAAGAALSPDTAAAVAIFPGPLLAAAAVFAFRKKSAEDGKNL